MRTTKSICTKSSNLQCVIIFFTEKFIHGQPFGCHHIPKAQYAPPLALNRETHLILDETSH